MKAIGVAVAYVEALPVAVVSDRQLVCCRSSKNMGNILTSSANANSDMNDDCCVRNDHF